MAVPESAPVPDAVKPATVAAPGAARTEAVELDEPPVWPPVGFVTTLPPEAGWSGGGVTGVLAPEAGAAGDEEPPPPPPQAARARDAAIAVSASVCFVKLFRFEFIFSLPLVLWMVAALAVSPCLTSVFVSQ